MRTGAAPPRVLDLVTSPGPDLQRLLDEAPYVRLLARQLLAEHADDVEQQTWLQAIQHGPRGVDRPRAWLAQIVRNVAASLCRTRSRQTPPSPREPANVPSSADLMQQEEQRHQLVTAVDRLPEQLRAVVLLRYFEGLTPQAIARQLDLPVTTIWNQLRRALQLLRERLDHEHGGDRRAWTVPLLTLAKPPAVAAATTAVGAATLAGVGAAVMTMKTWTKIAAVAALLVLAGTAVLLSSDPGPTPLPDDAHPPRVAQADVAGPPPDGTIVPEAPTQRQADTLRQAAPVAAAPSVAPPATTGSLVVHVLAADKSPAAEVLICARPQRSDARTAGVRRRADEQGLAVFHDLAAGTFEVTSDRSGSRRTEIVAGQTTEIDFVLEAGLLLKGIVVDAAGAPVAGAAIDVVSLLSAADYETLTHSGPDGSFSVPHAPNVLLVGARAAGYRASQLQAVQGRPGNAFEVRLELGGGGGCVEGEVVDAQGTPVVGALVCIGNSSMRGAPDGSNRAPALPALVRSDEQGRFLAIGVAPGNQAAQARAAGHAPWRGSCEVTGSVVVPLRIVLEAGGALRGTVRADTGEPVAGAFVSIGDLADFRGVLTHTAKDGSFEIADLSPGPVTVAVRHHRFGKSRQAALVIGAATTQCEVTLSRGVVFRGRIVDGDGEPITTAQVEYRCNVPVEGFDWVDQTDKNGEFELQNCPAGELLNVRIRASGYEPFDLSRVDPAAGPYQWTLQRSSAGRARITGTITAPDGVPLANVTVDAYQRSGEGSAATITRSDGRFDFRNLPPGAWHLTARANDFPLLIVGTRTLAADATWDLGQLGMVVGGTAVVTVEGDMANVYFRSLDAEGRMRNDWSKDGNTVRSQLLPPGEHRLLVSGPDVVPQAIAFTVRSSQDTAIAVQLGTGTRQRFAFGTAGLDPLPQRLVVRVLRDGQLLRHDVVLPKTGADAPDSTCLPPGDYVVTVSADDRELGRAAFTVTTTEAAPLRLELR